MQGRRGIDRDDAALRLEELAGSLVGGEEGEEAQKVSQSQALVKLAENVELFHNEDNAFATVEVARPRRGRGGAAGPSHRETHPLRSKGFRSWLCRQFWNAYGKRRAQRCRTRWACWRAGRCSRGRSGPFSSASPATTAPVPGPGGRAVACGKGHGGGLGGGGGAAGAVRAAAGDAAAARAGAGGAF